MQMTLLPSQSSAGAAVYLRQLSLTRPPNNSQISLLSGMNTIKSVKENQEIKENDSGEQEKYTQTPEQNISWPALAHLVYK